MQNLKGRNTKMRPLWRKQGIVCNSGKVIVLADLKIGYGMWNCWQALNCHSYSRGLFMLSAMIIMYLFDTDEYAPTLRSEEGIWKALGRDQIALDKYWRCRLVLNAVGPYPNDWKPLKDIRQYLGQFTHMSHTYHDRTGVIEGALWCSITGLGLDSLFGWHYPYPFSSYLLSSQLPHV